jgi:hypothetical protein
MKKVLLFVIVLMVSIAFASTGFAQEKPKAAPAAKPAAEAAKPAAEAAKPAAEAAKPAEAAAKPAEAAKPKPKPIPGFVGTVAKTDPGLMTVKGAKDSVTFDVSMAKLKGYKYISDIKVGDKVAVEYKKGTAMVTKLAGAKAKKEKAKADKPKADKPKKEKKADKPKEAKPAEKPAAK